MIQAPLQLQPHNPDVLMCIANLSNDEVFTPPELVNQMLDTLEASWSDANDGASIWENKEVTFLDPCTKSGVFLREIVKRLTIGLEREFPDLTERVNHILTKQVYGIAITELTSLLARRSLYCSKFANGIHSVARVFKTEEGNIWFERTEHTWEGGKCKFCGASKAEYARSKNLESHAYAFIHGESAKSQLSKMFGGTVQFDVIIGNPPYQLSDGGYGASASPIYHLFVEQAMGLDPRFISLVIPAKWYSGGKGLDEFREKMLHDKRIRYLADFRDSRDAFSGVDVAGGVCYFLWSRDNPGRCRVETFDKGESFVAIRDLDEFDMFVRDNQALEIIHKVLKSESESLSALVSSRKPFGIPAAQTSDPFGDCFMFSSLGDGKIRRSDVPKGIHLIDKWKVLVSKTSSEHAGQSDKAGTRRVLSRIEVMPPGSICTESYLVLGPFSDEIEARRMQKYLRTRFVRYLVSTILLTQNVTKSMFQFVPRPDLSRDLSDVDLFQMYGLSDREVEAICKLIRQIDANDD
jgi:site-specific DNA-methyltransferase (adenine-specific)